MPQASRTAAPARACDILSPAATDWPGRNLHEMHMSKTRQSRPISHSRHPPLGDILTNQSDSVTEAEVTSSHPHDRSNVTAQELTGLSTLFGYRRANLNHTRRYHFRRSWTYSRSQVAAYVQEMR
ncbi:hypothetical protein TgHK011_001590 [Trichoderma gracile]|nr:hypothetical protein TgHK011_001590 [Trichoderma gracile]